MTIAKLKNRVQAGELLTMLTAYDYPMARILDSLGIDIILVGDSLGMVVRGEDNTLGVSLDDMIYHTKMVRRAVQNAFLIADMPFMSVQISPEEALRNAARLVREGGAQAVKIEGGSPLLRTIEKIVVAGIPVMGHLGFTPQSVHQLGGYKVQGKDPQTAQALIAEAKGLEAAGVFALVLEMVPAELAQKTSQAVSVPVIGCGAGPHCDGQVLVTHDVLGLYSRPPKFAKQYVNLQDVISGAVKQYIEEVKGSIFPSEGYSF